MTKFQRAIVIAGLTILAAFVGSVLSLGSSPFHSSVRELAFGAMSASGCLLILWVAIASVALVQWKARPRILLALFVPNAAIAAGLLSELVK